VLTARSLLEMKEAYLADVENSDDREKYARDVER
jgi:hypothetical protein